MKIDHMMKNLIYPKFLSRVEAAFAEKPVVADIERPAAVNHAVME